MFAKIPFIQPGNEWTYGMSFHGNWESRHSYKPYTVYLQLIAYVEQNEDANDTQYKQSGWNNSFTNQNQLCAGGSPI